MPSSVEQFAAHLSAEDRGRPQLIVIRPVGPFQSFDARLTDVATRHVRDVRVRIFRTWDHAAEHDLGFVSPRLPTVIVVRDGEVVAKSIGDLPRHELERLAAGQARSRREARRA
jgi:hypothetical protein